MEELISQARNGDPDAFTALMESQMQNMYKAARAILNRDEGGTVGSLQRRGYCRCDFGYDSGVLGETFPVEGSQIFSYLDDQDSAEQM